MINGKFLGSGQEGILYVSADNSSVLKVFFRDYFPYSIDHGYSRALATEEFNNMARAFNCGIKVPKPIQLLTVVLDSEDLKDVKPLERASNSIENRDPNSLIGKSRFAIRRQFIPGKSLYKRVFPSRSVRQKVREMHEEIERAGLVYSDVKADNYVLTPKGEVYIVDCRYLVPRNSLVGFLNRDWKQQKIPTCRIGEWFETLRLSLS